MPKSDPSRNLPDYAPVAERVALFYARYPTGRILTKLVSRTEREVLFRAAVYRGPDETAPAATGWAAEREGDGDVNSVACVENTETSAIGRALANLGFTASRERASAEEMAKASRARARLVERAQAVASPTSEARAPAAPLATPTAPSPDERSALVADLLRLLSVAERAGVRPRRAASWRAVLAGGAPSAAELLRYERRLRGWLLRRLP